MGSVNNDEALIEACFFGGNLQEYGPARTIASQIGGECIDPLAHLGEQSCQGRRCAAV
jgi:hypothetical protein